MVRRYEPGDEERVVEITVGSFDGVSIDQGIERVCGPVAGRGWRWRKGLSIRDDIAADPDGVFVAEADGAVVAVITSRADARTGIGWIANIATDPAYRGRGVGRALMDAALAYLRERGMRAAKIETLEQNDIGRAFYPSAGFQEVARQIHYAMDLDPAQPASPRRQ